MTTAADDSAAEEAFEAFLAGRPVPEREAGLAAFAEAVRATATLPGRPNAALADLLAGGLLTDQPAASPRTARRVGTRTPSPVRMRRRVPVFFLALFAKIAGAGAVAHAATGAGIALVAFTGAGAAGVLPDSLQHGFADVVGTVGIQVEDPTTPAERTPAGVPSSTGSAPRTDGAAGATEHAADVTQETDGTQQSGAHEGGARGNGTHGETGQQGRDVAGDPADDRRGTPQQSWPTAPSTRAEQPSSADGSGQQDQDRVERHPSTPSQTARPGSSGSPGGTGGGWGSGQNDN